MQIRNWQLHDAAELSAAINNKKIQDNLRDGLPFPYTESDAVSYIQFVLDTPQDDAYYWAIVEDAQVIGSIGLLRQENIHCRTAELGYYIAEPYWGRGIVTEAVKEACRFAFSHTNLVRIFAEPFAKNTGSCRVLEKAGFTFEGVLRLNALKNGELLDMRMYALLRDDA
ncbi:MAG: GNAT family N-acetyltransferase [Lachnospiraceae bacterium]